MAHDFILAPRDRCYTYKLNNGCQDNNSSSGVSLSRQDRLCMHTSIELSFSGLSPRTIINSETLDCQIWRSENMPGIAVLVALPGRRHQIVPGGH